VEYETAQKESINTHLSRILNQELVAVQFLAADSSIDMPFKIHECRKHIKKTRSVIRMIKPAFSKDTWKALKPVLRNSGKVLSELRELDAHLNV